MEGYILLNLVAIIFKQDPEDVNVGYTVARSNTKTFLRVCRGSTLGVRLVIVGAIIGKECQLINLARDAADV